MNILVFVKTNPDLQMIRIKNREPVMEAVPYKVGDLEKNAVEAALQLRDTAGGGVIKAVCLAEANRKARETLKEVLAMGADEAVLVADPALETVDQAAVALVLARAAEKAGPYDLLLFGEGSTDNYSGQVGPRVAEILGIPQIGYARSITVTAGGVRVERSMDEFIEVLEAPFPVAVTVVSEINEPRIPSLMNIMKAGKKPLAEYTLADIGLEAAAVARQGAVLSNLAEEQDRKHVIFAGDPAAQAEALVNALIKEGVLGR
ncbi:MAG: electron transfer flavoprotein subunit beta/FixA family protein [Thermoleophilia bacterium]